MSEESEQPQNSDDFSAFFPVMGLMLLYFIGMWFWGGIITGILGPIAPYFAFGVNLIAALLILGYCIGEYRTQGKLLNAGESRQEVQKWVKDQKDNLIVVPFLAIACLFVTVTKEEVAATFVPILAVYLVAYLILVLFVAQAVHQAKVRGLLQTESK